MQDQISELFFVRGDPEDEPELPECPESCVHRKAGLHFHCKWVSIQFRLNYLVTDHVVPKISQKMKKSLVQLAKLLKPELWVYSMYLIHH